MRKRVDTLNRREFMDQLAKGLAVLPEHARRDILDDYEQRFQAAAEAGRGEEEVVSELGHPRSLARYHHARHALDAAEGHGSLVRFAEAFGAAAALGVFSFLSILGPVLAAVVMLLPIFALGAFLTFAAGWILAAALRTFLEPQVLFLPFNMLVLGFGSAAVGLIVLFLAAMAGRLCFRLGLRYLRWNVDVLGRR